MRSKSKFCLSSTSIDRIFILSSLYHICHSFSLFKFDSKTQSLFRIHFSFNLFNPSQTFVLDFFIQITPTIFGTFAWWFTTYHSSNSFKIKVLNFQQYNKKSSFLRMSNQLWACNSIIYPGANQDKEKMLPFLRKLDISTTNIKLVRFQNICWHVGAHARSKNKSYYWRKVAKCCFAHRWPWNQFGFYSQWRYFYFIKTRTWLCVTQINMSKSALLFNFKRRMKEAKNAPSILTENGMSIST